MSREVIVRAAMEWADNLPQKRADEAVETRDAAMAYERGENDVVSVTLTLAGAARMAAVHEAHGKEIWDAITSVSSQGEKQS